MCFPRGWPTVLRPGRCAFLHRTPLSPDTQAVFARINADVRSHLGELTRSIILKLQESIPAYAAVSYDDLVEGVAGDIGRASDAVSAGRAISAEELKACEEVGQRRAEQEIPVEGLIRAFQIGAEETLVFASQHGERLGAGPRELLDFNQIGWAWANQAITHAVLAHRRTELALARRDVHQRDELLRRLVLDPGPTAEMQMRVPLYGLSPSVGYSVVRARGLPGSPIEPPALVELLRRARPTGALIGIVEGDVVAIVSGTAPTVPEHYCAGVAGPAPLLELRGPFDDASRALHTAWNFRRAGPHRLEELGLLPSVILDRRLGDALTRRFVTALGSEREQERICLTIEALFECDMRVADAAAALYVHENTVRKRLRVAEERAGISLRRIDDLVAVWWALMHRRAGLAEATSDDEGAAALKRAP